MADSALAVPSDAVADRPPIPYEKFLENIRRLKRERWDAILASEPPGPVERRRPPDPEKEAILLQLERARLERQRRESVREGGSSPDPESPNTRD